MSSPDKTVVIALTSAPQVEWAKSYPVEINRRGLAVAAEGGLFVASRVAAGATKTVFRLTSSGSPSWAVQYQSAGFPYSVVETNDGGSVIAFAGSDLEVLKLDAQGKMVFARTVPVGSYPQPQLGATASGVLVAAVVSSGLVTCTLDPAGSVGASQLYAGWTPWEPRLTTLPAGGFLIGAGTSTALRWAKLGLTGVMTDLRILPEAANNQNVYFMTVSFAADGGFLLGSGRYSFAPFFDVTKVAPDGMSCPASQAQAAIAASSFPIVTTNGGAVTASSITASTLVLSTSPFTGSWGQQTCP